MCNRATYSIGRIIYEICFVYIHFRILRINRAPIAAFGLIFNKIRVVYCK